MNRNEFIKGAASVTGLGMMGSMMNNRNQMIDRTNSTKSLNLKINDIKTFVVNREGSNENFVYVKIYTNQGITGLGEGTLSARALTVQQAILEHKDFLIGRDPGDIEWLWQYMFRALRFRGGNILMNAISAIEIALWDIKGKALGVPIWELLGGKARNKVRVYIRANNALDPKNPYKQLKGESFNGDETKQAAENWVRRKNEGWTACKASFISDDMPPTGRNTRVRDGIKQLQAVREAVGEDFDILVETHGKPTPPMARDFCKEAEAFHPMFIEEPGQIEDLGEWERLRSHTSAPLATGERLTTKFGFKELCHRHLVDYVQPDVIHAGGIMELKKIGAIAEANRIEMIPHNPNSLVCTMASLNVNMCTPNAVMLEIGSGSFCCEQFRDMFYGATVEFEEGYALPPQKPGLGIDLDEEVAAKFPYEPKRRYAPLDHDGSVSDG